MAGYDLLGNIAIIKFSRETGKAEKIKFAKKLLKENKGIKTILEKTGKFSGRLRTAKNISPDVTPEAVVVVLTLPSKVDKNGFRNSTVPLMNELTNSKRGLKASVGPALASPATNTIESRSKPKNTHAFFIISLQIRSL
jgi:hypothetical protein